MSEEDLYTNQDDIEVLQEQEQEIQSAIIEITNDKQRTVKEINDLTNEEKALNVERVHLQEQLDKKTS